MAGRFVFGRDSFRYGLECFGCLIHLQGLSIRVGSHVPGARSCSKGGIRIRLRFQQMEPVEMSCASTQTDNPQDPWRVVPSSWLAASVGA
eukprot:s3412_g6.t1